MFPKREKFCIYQRNASLNNLFFNLHQVNGKKITDVSLKIKLHTKTFREHEMNEHSNDPDPHRFS